MTYREEEILKLALERGYFDFPKRIKLEELASATKTGSRGQKFIAIVTSFGDYTE